MTKKIQQEEAIRLRCEGRWATKPIAKHLGVSVGSVSGWLAAYPLTDEEKKSKNAIRSKFFNRKKSTQQNDEYTSRWLEGKETGNHKNEHQLMWCVRRYVWKKYKEQCAECGWSKVNPVSGKIPLTIHHINGNSQDSSESNLILLCPNCHSLTESYGNLNRGKGRKNRHISASVA